jgi:hypothetical protein
VYMSMFILMYPAFRLLDGLQNKSSSEQIYGDTCIF